MIAAFNLHDRHSRGDSIAMCLARWLKTSCLLAPWCVVSFACCAAGPVVQIGPGDYQAFLTKWMPGSAPLCAVMQTSAQWSRVLHPAAVMWNNRRFAPPADFWKDHAVLLLGRSVFGTNDAKHIFRLDGVSRGSGTMTLSVHFEPPHPSSYKMGWFIAVAVNKPLPPQIAFVENDAAICKLDPRPGRWLSPVAR